MLVDFDFVENGKIAGFHPGVVAVVPNLIIATVGSFALKGVNRAPEKKSIHQN